MKKLVLSMIIVSLVCFKSIGQHSQGSISVGGTFMLSSSKETNENNNTSTDGPKTINFKIVPSVEYFMSDKFSVGLGLGFSTQRVKRNNYPEGSIVYDEYVVSHPRFVLNPFARMYFPLGDRVNLFGEGFINFETGKDKYEYTDNNRTDTYKFKASDFSIGITPGIQFMVSQKIALEATFGFVGYQSSYNEWGTNSSTKNGGFGLNLDPSSFLNFGFRYFIK
jgi:hypothetical protein